MWVTVILSASSSMWAGRKQSSHTAHTACVGVPLCGLFPLTLSDRKAWCVVVLQYVGCGHHSSVKGHLLRFFSQCFASHPLPTTCAWIPGGASAQHYHCQAPLLVHSSALSQTMWVCRELGSLSFPSPISPAQPPTVCLLTWPGVVLGPGPRVPVCVLDIRPS